MWLSNSVHSGRWNSVELHSTHSSSPQIAGLLREGFGTQSTQSAGIDVELKSISARLSQDESSIDPKNSDSHTSTPQNTHNSAVPVGHLYGAQSLYNSCGLMDQCLRLVRFTLRIPLLGLPWQTQVPGGAAAKDRLCVT